MTTTVELLKAKKVTDAQIEKIVDALQPNETCLVYIKKINGGKFSLELVERMESEENVLSMLNKSDSRFAQSRVRPAWINGEAVDIIKNFGLSVTVAELNKLQVATSIPDAELIEGTTKLNLGIVNPKIAGMQLRVQIVEQVGTPQYEGQNPKRKGKDGAFLTKDGELIYSQTTVVANKASHVRVQHNGEITVLSGFSRESVNAARQSFIGEDSPE